MQLTPEETATRSNEFLEELFHQFSDEKTSTTSSSFEAETLPTRSPVLPQPEQVETTTIDPLTLKYYYLYKTLQNVEVEEKKDEYQLVRILNHFISYILIIYSKIETSLIQLNASCCHICLKLINIYINAQFLY